MNEQLASYEEVADFACPAEFWPALGYEGAARYVAVYWEQCGDEASWADGRSSMVGAGWPAYLALMEHNFAPRDRRSWRLGSSESPAEAWLVIDREAERAWLVPPVEAERLLREQYPVVDAGKNSVDSAEDGTGVVAIVDWEGLVERMTSLWREEPPDMEAIERAMAESAARYDALAAELEKRRPRWTLSGVAA